jgi:hypothetical protein
MTLELNEGTDTHLWGGSFEELAANHISPSDDDVLLVVGRSDDEAQAVRTAIERTLNSAIDNCTIYTGGQQELPFSPNTYDVVVHINRGQQILHRHNPLYEVTTVAKKGGTVVFNAPNWLVQSGGVDFEAIYAVDWEDDTEINLAAVGTATVDGSFSDYEESSIPSSMTISASDQTGWENFV